MRILHIARTEVLAAPDRWTKGWYAFDAARVRQGATSERAICWCLGGALDKARDRLRLPDTYENGTQEANDALMTEIRSRSLGYPNIPEFNDASETKYEDVLDVLQKAELRLQRELA